MTEVFVNMGEISSAKNHGILTTVGLGSCIGATLYDHYHILWPYFSPAQQIQ